MGATGIEPKLYRVKVTSAMNVVNSLCVFLPDLGSFCMVSALNGLIGLKF